MDQNIFVGVPMAKSLRRKSEHKDWLEFDPGNASVDWGRNLHSGLMSLFLERLCDWDNQISNYDGIKIKFLWFDIITPSTGLNNNIFYTMLLFELNEIVSKIEIAYEQSLLRSWMNIKCSVRNIVQYSTLPKKLDTSTEPLSIIFYTV